MESIFRIEVSELFHAVLIVEGINDFFVKDNMQKGYDYIISISKRKNCCTLMLNLLNVIEHL